MDFPHPPIFYIDECLHWIFTARKMWWNDLLIIINFQKVLNLLEISSSSIIYHRSQNQFESTECSFFPPVILVPPSPPSVSRLSDTSVMVNWSVPENDGLPITFFRVQYKEVKPNKGPWQTLDRDIDAKARRYEVSRLRAGNSLLLYAEFFLTFKREL